MMRFSMLASAAAGAIVFGCAGPASAQPAPLPSSGLKLDQIVIRAEPPSQARGLSLPSIPDTIIGANAPRNQAPPGVTFGGTLERVVAAENGQSPAGIEPLPRDLYSSDDFYADKDLWMDQRYWRCNAPWAIEATWGAYFSPTTGEDFPRTVSWGYCDRDYPREQIVSPYTFKTAQEHYEALLAEARSRGGPTQYSADNRPPDWDGIYDPQGFGQKMTTRTWITGWLTQIPTYLSLLTPEYQQRFVQQMWHDAHNQIAWPASYCWPDGYIRRWAGMEAQWIMVTPKLVQVRSKVNEAIVNDIYVGDEFDMTGAVPNLIGDVRQYYGDSIGFWDDDMLITWTSNIKGWIGHGTFETSNDLQTIEIYSPIDDPNGKFIGLVHETILYDDQAFAQPLRIVERWEQAGDLQTIKPIGWGGCVLSLFPIDGLPVPKIPGDTVEFTVPDLNGRPWADLWVKYFEQNMQRPAEQNDVLSGFD